MPKKKLQNVDIPQLRQEAQTIQFSFKHVECDRARFPLHDFPPEFLAHLLGELKRYSFMSIEDFQIQDHEYSRHTFDPGETNEKEGFAVAVDSFEYSEHWQFGIGPKAQGWRAFGLLVGTMFYLCWLSANHDVYNTPRT